MMDYKTKAAQDVNFTADIFRTIKVDRKLNLVEGEYYDNQNKVESWAYGYADFEAEDFGEYEYTFYCNNVPCHKVDYENEEEVEQLVAYENENEVLVKENAKMKIVSVSTDEDYEEMGYYQIDLEFEGFEE